MIISKTDFVDVLQLSTRAYNNLRRAKIHTVQDFLSFSPEEYIGIRNIGQKTLSEILNCLERIKTNDIIVVDKIEETVSTPNIAEIKTFIYTDGNRYEDIKINDMGLSVRAYNCLNKEGVLYFSEIAFKNENDLFNIDNMGRVSICEIQNKYRIYKLKLRRYIVVDSY